MSTFTGTASVTNNSNSVTVSGFTLSPLAIFPGAQVSINGDAYYLASVTNTTTFTLTRPYTGETASNVPLEINTISEDETKIVTLNQRTADLLEDLLDFDPNGNLESLSELQGNGVIVQDAVGQHSLRANSTIGDASGPASSTDNAIVSFSGTTGKLLKAAAMPTARIKGRVAAGTGVIQDLTAAQTQTFLGMSSYFAGILGSANGDALFTAMGKTQANSANGFIRLPNGLIIQWGVVGVGSGSVNVTFPTTFPNLMASVQATIVDSVTTVMNTSWSISISSQSTSGFTAQRRYSQGTGVAGAGEAFRWLAVGY